MGTGGVRELYQGGLGNEGAGREDGGPEGTSALLGKVGSDTRPSSKTVK